MWKKGKLDNLIDQRFGKLTVLRLISGKNNSESVWECSCLCGNTVEVKGQYLRHSLRKSCGCLRPGRKTKGLAPEAKAWRIRYQQKRSRALKEGLVFELDIDIYIHIASESCYLCGCPPEKRTVKVYASPQPILATIYSSSIDRLDSSKGYTIMNSKPCCDKHNFMKLQMSEEEFINACLTVIQYKKPELLK